MSRSRDAWYCGIPLPALALALVAGCAGGGMEGGRDAASASGMFPHFLRVGLVHDAVIHGDTAGARVHARSIADHGGPAGLPHGSEDYVERLRVAARGAAAAPDLHALGMETAAMAAACGACHQAFDDGPTLPPPGTPRANDTELPHMWAASRLWEGLTGPSNAHWQAGAQVLATAPFGGSLARPNTAALAAMARRIGAQAEQVRDEGQRTRLYGELLTTCASCHELLGVTPR